MPAIQSLYEYVFGYTTDINYRLRHNKMTPEYRKIANDLQSLMKKQKFGVLYRGMDWEHFTNDFKITKDNIDSFVGGTFTDRGFASTSLNPREPLEIYSNSGKSVYMKIQCPSQY